MVYRCEVGWFPLDRLALSSPSKARVVLAMNRAWQRIQPRSHGRSKLRSVIQWLFNGWLVVLTCFNHQPHGNFMKFSGISWWSNVECWFSDVISSWFHCASMVIQWLIGGWATPWKIWKSDWIIIPTIGEIKHVPNHPPDGDFMKFSGISWNFMVV